MDMSHHLRRLNSLGSIKASGFLFLSQGCSDGNQGKRRAATRLPVTRSESAIGADQHPTSKLRQVE
jgi:hypothetical protein